MGTSHSRPREQQSQGQVVSKNPPVQQPPEPPYHGPPAQYHFVNTQVTISTNLSFSFTSAPMVSSNVDEYYPLLAGQYAHGFRLLSFYRIPGQMHQQNFFGSKVALGFQGIFCRYPNVPPRENFQLRIEKSVIQLQRMFTGIISYNQGMVSDTSHIIESIARNTQEGGRLICIEMTGQTGSQQMGMAMQGFSPLMGVDVFYEVPTCPVPERYTYNCVSVPMVVTVTMGLRPTPRVECDWMGTLAAHLNQGWRLIEIFKDNATFSQQRGFGTGHTTMNTLWFFEKAAERMNNPTPVYQGTIVDHDIKIKTGFGAVNTTANWEPLIQDMGNKGWELACIMETPEWTFSGMATIYMRCKLFFQRPILAQPQTSMPVPSAAPPAYHAVAEGNQMPPAPPPEKMGY